MWQSLEADPAAERALVVFAGGREEIVTDLQFEDARPDAAVILPVPAQAQVSALEGDADLFG